MKLAYVTMFDASDICNWSGTYFYMHKALESQGVQIELLGNLQHGRSVSRRLRKMWAQNIEQKNFLHFWDLDTAKDFCKDVDRRLSKLDVDGILSPSLVPLAYLKSNLPKILWTDATFSGLSQFYDEFNPDLTSAATIQHGQHLDNLAEKNCDLLMFASDWAAASALRANPFLERAKVEVVPFGANLSEIQTETNVDNFISARSSDEIKLLFVGVDWPRKGGEKAVQIAVSVNQLGFKVSLTIIGCTPPAHLSLPEFVRVVGRLDKSIPDQKKQLESLYEESHFLVVPTCAEAYGLVFAEASAYGVLSLSHCLGGVPTVVTENLNGFLFDVDCPVGDWSERITSVFQNKLRLRELALSSFREYKARLNWQIAGARAVELIQSRCKIAT